MLICRFVFICSCGHSVWPWRARALSETVVLFSKDTSSRYWYSTGTVDICRVFIARAKYNEVHHEYNSSNMLPIRQRKKYQTSALHATKI